jgi:class 3 adenylate cyclase/predicted ATPase
MLYRFSNCELNTQLFTLQRAGQNIRLRPKVFQVLSYLLEHRERVVSKQELSEQVWPEQFISNAALESTIRLLRQALGDSGQTQRIVQTVYGYGYRFVAEVTRAVEEVAREPAVAHPWQTTSAPPTSPRQRDVESTVAPARDLHEAERRQLTVLVCDLVEAMALSERISLEALHMVIQAYQEVCREVFQRYGGHIAQNLGHRLVVYFGYPEAHEDDARRAVLAGLEVLDAFDASNRRVTQHQLPLAGRLGIHTGVVVMMGEWTSGDRHTAVALGDTPHLAMQLPGYAAPGTVVMSAATARLVEGYFFLQDLGCQRFEGMAAEVQVWRVVAPSTARGRLDLVPPGRLTPFVGREAEVALLLERWHRVAEGTGQVVLLSGEVGIGKSRLVWALQERLAEEGYIHLECHGSPYHQHSALYPVVELFEEVLQWRHDDTPETKWAKLETRVAQYALPASEVAPLVAAFLGLPLPAERCPPHSLDSQQQRRKTLEALLRMIVAFATHHPVLWVVEDLHWLDPSTLELLTMLVDQLPTTQIYLLATYRPTFQAPWGNRSYLTQIPLARLSRPQVEAMMLRLTGEKPLPAELGQQVVERTDGVPLFVEEFTKSVLEMGMLREGHDRFELTAPLRMLHIPTTLHDSLMARLDRLGPAKSVAQLGAVFGRHFPYTILEALVPHDETSLLHALDQLVKAELLYQRGVPPQATYAFKHVLIQSVELQPELLAHHYTQAGLPEQAVPYWQRAGRRAVERSAYAEGIVHLTTGLELLSALPETAVRAQQELALLTTLGPALMTVKGYGAPDVARVYARARQLCHQLGDTRRFLSVLLGLGTFHLVRAEYHTAREIGDDALRLAQGEQHPGRLLQAHLAFATAVFFLGETVTARDHLLQGIALDDPQDTVLHAVPGTSDPRVVCRAFAALALWPLGYADQARHQGHAAFDRADVLQHPISRAAALTWMSLLSHYLRDVQKVREQTEAALAIATQQNVPSFRALALVLRGWALAMQDRGDAGLPQLRQGLADYQAAGGEVGRSFLLALLAEAWAKGGMPETGLGVLDEALAHVKQTDERWWEAELYRLKGELILQSAAKRCTSHVHACASEAEAHFLRARQIAGQQQTKSWELRAAMSLARLWQTQDRRAEASQMLRTLSHWFTEGFDTPDLQEAHALLDALQ